MKKIILIIVVVTFITNYCSAQENSNKQGKENDFRNQLLYGIKAGANYSNIYDTKAAELNADFKFGLVTGVFLSVPIGKFLGVQPEILFSQKGFQATGTINGGAYKFTRTTNFIDVPLLASLKLSKFLTVLAGPQFSYLMEQSDAFASSTINNNQVQEFKNDNPRKNILCFIGGFDITQRHFVLGLRAGWDIQNNNGDGTSTNPRYKNVWYQATLGFRF